LQQNETKEIHPEEGENGDYLFSEINNPDFEETIGSIITELMATHSDDQELVEKAVSTESVSEARRRGLVPQSGDWEKPRRWVRPEDADVPVDTGEKPRKQASVDLVISSETKEAMKSIFGAAFDISDFQDMYSIGLEDFSTEIHELQQDKFLPRFTARNLRITVKINAKEEQDSPGVVTAEEERILHLTRRDADFERFRIDRQNLISRIRREEGIPTLVNIMEGNRDVVGTMVRSFSRKDGKLIVTHDSFSLPTSFQGLGIASDINENVEKEYERLGVSEITLLANAEIGGYAWARQGYDFANAISLENTKLRFLHKLEEGLIAPRRYDEDGLYVNQTFSEEEEAELADQINGFSHSWQFAKWNPTNAPHGEHLGKTWMLGHNWEAKKTLDKDSESYKRGKIYYALKRRENEQTS